MIPRRTNILYRLLDILLRYAFIDRIASVGLFITIVACVACVEKLFR